MAETKNKFLLHRIYGWLWTLIVTLLVLAAVLLTVVRLALPYAQEYRTDLEVSLSQALGKKVTVGNLTAELKGLSPTLVVEDIAIYASSGKDIQFRLQRLDIGFSVKKSLQEKRAIPVSLGLSGSELHIVRTQARSFTVNGIKLDLAARDEQKPISFPPVLNWLFENARLSVDGIKLNYEDRLNKQQFALEATQLKLRNSGSRHQIDGLLILPTELASGAGFSIDIEAEDMRDIKSWKSNAFVAIQELNIAQLQRRFLADTRVQGKGVLTTRIWSSWNGLNPQGFSGDIAVNNLEVGQGKAATGFQVANLNTRFRIEREAPKHWTLDIQKLQLTDRAISREASRILASYDLNNRQLQLHSNLLYIQDLRRVIQASGVVDTKQQELLAQLAPSGELRDLHLRWQQATDKSPNFDLGFRTRDLSSRAWKKFPRVKGLDAVVWMDESSGSGLISSENMQLDIAHVFRYPWSIDKMQGLVQWRKYQDSWHIMSEELTLDGRDADMVARMHLMLGNKKHPGYLDLLARFDNAEVSELKRYYPVNVMKPNVVDWLDRSLQQGTLHNGGVVYRGWLSKGSFPFRKKQGKFEVGFRSKDVLLSYSDAWPAVKEMVADISFVEAGMLIKTDSASIEGMKVESFDVRIDNFKRPWLILQGKVAGGTSQALAFLENSPIRESFAPLAGRLEASGSSHLDLDMRIPLNKKLGTTRYRGVLKLTDSGIRSRLGEGELNAEAMNGSLVFTEQAYSAKSISGRMFSRPMTLNVTTTPLDNGRVVELNLHGRANAVDLQDEIKLGLLDFLRGESDYTARLLIHQGQRKETLLSIESDMQGMAVDLPEPLLKPQNVKQRLLAEWDTNTEQFALSLGEQIHSVFWLDNSGQNSRLRRGDLHFGPGMPKIPDSNVIRLSGRLEHFPLAKWMDEFSKLKSVGGFPERTPLEITMDYLEVQAVEKVNEAVISRARNPNPRALPELRVNIQQLAYKDLQLGRFSLNANPFSSGYKIDTLDFNGPLLQFESKGYWEQGSDALTALSINATAPNSEALLTSFGFDSPIKGGNLHIRGDIQWPGSPDKFDLAKAEGKLAFNIRNGRLINIEPGAGRVLGLLSFQALPRRLALDFRDLFGRGYRFDSIQGEFTIEDGNARTTNTSIFSTVARVYMSGRIGLQTRDYDQDVIVVLGDGSNYFVAGALAGGIQTGVIVWVMEKVLDIEKNSRLIYKITGSWENPVVTSLDEPPSP